MKHLTATNRIEMHLVGIAEKLPTHNDHTLGK